MLMPLAIDMYLPALPIIATEFGVSNGKVQMTLSTYILGFAIGQILYGPISDCQGRKPVILFGTLSFTLAAAACALSTSVEILINIRLLHGLSAAAISVVINAIMRDMFTRDDFSRMMSFVILVMTVGLLLAPIIGGELLTIFNWNSIFWTISLAGLVATLLVIIFIRETLPREQRQKFQFSATISNFRVLFQNKCVFSYMLASGFSFAGMFTFLSSGPFIYINLNHISPKNFGYYFATNIVCLFILTLINSYCVAYFRAQKMFFFGLSIQFITSLWLLIVLALKLSFIPLVIGVSLFIGCMAMVTTNSMAVILDEFPHMAGTVSSIAGMLRFGIGAIIGGLLSFITFNSAWPMVLSIVFCSTSSLLCYLYSVYLPDRNILSLLDRLKHVWHKITVRYL